MRNSTGCQGPQKHSFAQPLPHGTRFYLVIYVPVPNWLPICNERSSTNELGTLAA